MRVAIDYRMAEHTGIGQYLRQVLPATLAADPGLQLLLLVPDSVPPPSPLPARMEWARWGDAPEIYSWREQTGFAALQAEHGFDLLHVPHFQAPLLAGPPMVITIHDLIFLHFPEECPSLAARLYAKAALPLVARRARRVITVSHVVAEDVHETLGVCRSKVICAPSGPPPAVATPDEAVRDAVRERVGIGPRYLLFAGMQRPRKNLVRLVEAYDESGLKDEGVHLVLAGPKDARGAAIATEIAGRGLRESVHQTGYLEAEDLHALYAGALGYVQPSLYEGFGFGPLDAWNHGLPVATSDAGAAPEVCGTAAIYFCPRDVAAMADALRTLALDEARRAELAAAGVARVRTLDWRDAGRQTARAYREALGA